MQSTNLLATFIAVMTLLCSHSTYAVNEDVNGGSLIVSMKQGEFAIFNESDCSWDDPKDTASDFHCRKNSQLPRDKTGELIMVKLNSRCLFIMNGTVSECPRNSRRLVRLKAIPGFKVNERNVLAIVDYWYEKR